MPIYRRNDVDPDRFFGGNINRLVAPGETVEADTNPGWQWFVDPDIEPVGHPVEPTPPPPAVEEPVTPSAPNEE